MKIFCIGHNKTGTSSLHTLFKKYGMSSCHGKYSEWKMEDPRFHEYQCFSDGENHDFRNLDRHFPGSKFVLTSRKLEDWLISRVRHIEIRRTLGKTGWMRKEYESGAREAIEGWINTRAQYHSEVFSYFKDRPTDFLTINICDSPAKDRALNTLVKFLQLPKSSLNALPHERSTDKVTKDIGGGIKNLFSNKYKPRSKKEIQQEIRLVLIQMNIPEVEWSSDGLP